MPSPANHPPVPVDLIIEPRWTIPIEPAGVVLEQHSVVVDRGDVLDVLPCAQATTKYSPRERMVLPDHVLMPGLVNLHTHAAMTLMRGIGDDLPLMQWLRERIWPAEQRLVSRQFVRDGTALACAEMLRGGITCFGDMYFFPDAAVEAAVETGMRIAAGMVVIDFPTAYASDADDYIAKGLAIRDRWRDTPQVSFCLAPHAPYTVSDAAFERIATLAAQLDLPIHLHVHETMAEIADSVERHGVRPLARLQRLGLLDPRLIAVHAVHLQTEEMDLLAHHGCAMAHCPTSNMKLASGIAPAAALLARGMRVGLGTDGAASNNRLDLFQEMRHAALLAKVSCGDAAVLPAHTVLHMATLGAASALGLDDRIGSVTVGKAADLCAVDLGEDIMLQPCFDPASHLIYAAGREYVSHVWVGGELRVAGGCLLHGNDSELLGKARLWQNSLRGKHLDES